MLKTLTSLCGVSGCEGEVGEFIKKNAVCDELTEDVLGNIIAFRKGTKGDRKVMFCAHTDEVGFIVSSITKEGFIRFRQVGGFDERILPGTKVLVGNNKISGVIGLKPVHLTSSEERERQVKGSELVIDIGADAHGIVNKGDYVALDSEFVQFGDGLFKAKAIDDRVGCAALLELLSLNKRYAYDLYVCFSVQEEAGLRGGKVLAQRIKPDIAVAVEATTCSDTGGGKPWESVTTLKKGPAVSVLDGTSYSINRLRELAFSIGREKNIPVQLKCSSTGGNDAGVFQRVGAESFVISLPARYIHSGVSVASTEDYENYKKLIFELAERI